MAKIEDIAAERITFSIKKSVAFFEAPPPKGPYLLTRDEMKAECSFDEDEAEVYDKERSIDLPADTISVGGKLYHLNQYFGSEWVDTHIMVLQNQNMQVSKTFAITPHDWHVKGAPQIDFLCRSIFQGGICGDAMGLGKTLLAILVMDLAKQERGSFSLVVCPAACRFQWRTEITSSFKKGSEPRVLILEDSKVSARELIAGKWDIIIVSYNFLTSTYRVIPEFKDKLKRFKQGEGPRPTRPVSALFSGLWRRLDLTIKRLILDECHCVKRPDGAFYTAVQALFRTATLMLSGTILGNRWYDVANPVKLLAGHPFQSRKSFIDAFSESQGLETPFDFPKKHMVWLQQFLLAFVIARPSSCLTLPGLRLKDVIFHLNHSDAENVIQLTVKFDRARRAQLAKHSSSDNAGQLNGQSPLGYAVKAQRCAAHSMLMGDSSAELELVDTGLEIEEHLNDTVTRILDSQPTTSLETRKEWLERPRLMDPADLQNSARVQAFLKVYKHARDSFPRERIVVFGIFLQFLDILAIALRQEFAVDALRFDGTVSETGRRKVQDEFASDGNLAPLLVTSGSGGVGLNLQMASVVIQTEVWWNRNCERQAYARCFRQGQNKEVKVFRLMAKNSSIDNDIVASQTRKADTNTALMGPLLRDSGAPPAIPPLEETGQSIDTRV